MYYIILNSNTTIKRQYKVEEEEVQKIISEIGIWSEIVENCFPVIFALFLGTWSDVYGYKLPFVLSISGVSFRYGGLLLLYYMECRNYCIIFFPTWIVDW
jgi:hypothetical protein